MGEGEKGRMGEWENGRKGEREKGREGEGEKMSLRQKTKVKRQKLKNEVSKSRFGRDKRQIKEFNHGVTQSYHGVTQLVKINNAF